MAAQATGIAQVLDAVSEDRINNVANKLVTIKGPTYEYSVTSVGDLLDGIWIWQFANGSGEQLVEPIDRNLAADLLHHLNQLYPELKIQNWGIRSATQGLSDKLSLLARSKACHIAGVRKTCPPA